MQHLVLDVKNKYSGMSGENILINASGFDPQEWVWINLSNDVGGLTGPKMNFNLQEQTLLV